MIAIVAEREEELPLQPSLRRIRQFDVRPKHDLGQNFLIDSNILGVIDRLAELEPDDVVLEIGGGLGVLSEHLAPLCGHLHVIELDRALVPALEDGAIPAKAGQRRRMHGWKGGAASPSKSKS